jgi:hypothetical protein
MNTAREILAKHSLRPLSLMDHPDLNIAPKDAIDAMIEFAQMHVDAALKAASNNAKQKFKDHVGNQTRFLMILQGTNNASEVEKESITSAYPHENIK